MTRSLGFKTGWMAAKGVDPRAFAEALGLRDPRPCNWEVGAAAAYSRGPTDDAFVVPAVDGWVLCVSVGVMLLDPSTLVRYTTRTAERLDTEVQLFATHRVSESHTWAMALPSGIRRAFSWAGDSGEQVLDLGDRTPGETAVFGPGDIAPQVDEQSVMALASAWSVDPSRLGEREDLADEGLVATFVEPTFPRPATAPAPRKPWWKLW